ncbi:MAG: hypothetical protein U0794_15115 [Isosphaeraceae bacterium]
MVNRRLRLKNGREADVRHAYALPPGSEVGGRTGRSRDRRPAARSVRRTDPGRRFQLRVPSDSRRARRASSTADLSGFAARVVEDNLDRNAVALFVQGCGGDINPVFYKDVDHPRHAEVLGNMLGLSTLKAARAVTPATTSAWP